MGTIPVEHVVYVNDYILIDDDTDKVGNMKKFQIKRMSSEPWFCLQELYKH